MRYYDSAQVDGTQLSYRVVRVALLLPSLCSLCRDKTDVDAKNCYHPSHFIGGRVTTGTIWTDLGME